MIDGGWTKIRIGSQEGLVPSSYTETLSSQTAPSSPGTERPGSSYSASSASLAGSIANSIKTRGPAVAPRRGAKRLKHVEALYDYSARTDAEHSMTAGDRLVLINADQGDGWIDVEKGGVVKSIPATYVQEV